MDEELNDYLRGREPQGFTRHPFYSSDGDTLTYYFEPDEAYSQRVDDLLTVYKSVQTDRLVGCKIKGVLHLVERLKNFGFALSPEDEMLRLNLLFLSAVGERPSAVHRYYEELGRYTRETVVNTRELQKS
jgi:hypothetical protein